MKIKVLFLLIRLIKRIDMAHGLNTDRIEIYTRGERCVVLSFKLPHINSI